MKASAPVPLIVLCVVAIGLGMSAPSCRSGPPDRSADESPMPQGFLTTGSRGWDAWLNGTANAVFWRHTGLAVVQALAGPGRIAVAHPERLPGQMNQFDASKTSRREALWILGGRTGAGLSWNSVEEPREFLGLLETESRRDGPGTVETVTVVSWSDPDTYRRIKAAGRIHREARFGGTIYFAEENVPCLPMGEASAMIVVTERFKVEMPAEAGK
jgi:hypothetical protein